MDHYIYVWIEDDLKSQYGFQEREVGGLIKYYFLPNNDNPVTMEYHERVMKISLPRSSVNYQVYSISVKGLVRIKQFLKTGLQDILKCEDLYDLHKIMDKIQQKQK